jgi:branched-chain amino acid aminotransferase
MRLPYTAEQIDAAQLEVIKANGLEECYLRPLAFYDGQAVGVSAEANDVHLAVAAWEWKSYAGPGAAETGLRVKTSSFMRHHVNTAMAKAKATGCYINSSMAAAEAKAQGFDDALMLDTTGHVAECSTSNVFVLIGDRLVTPDRSSILPGITRDTIMQLAIERGYALEERRLTRDELYCADEMFLTGTAIEVVPVVELDGRVIGNGKPGETTRKLQAAYFAAVRGQDESKRHWLTAVDLPSVQRANTAAALVH